MPSSPYETTAASSGDPCRVFGTAGISWGADFHKGLEVSRRGEIATALREWKLLGLTSGATGLSLLEGWSS